MHRDAAIIPREHRPFRGKPAGNARLTDGRSCVRYVMRERGDAGVWRQVEFAKSRILSLSLSLSTPRPRVSSPLRGIRPRPRPLPTRSRCDSCRQSLRRPSSRAYFYPQGGAKTSRPWLNALVTVLFLLSSGVALVNLWDVKSPTATAPRRRKRPRSAGSARELDIALGKYVPSGCLLCYILTRRMGGLLKRLVVTRTRLSAPLEIVLTGICKRLCTALHPLPRSPAPPPTSSSSPTFGYYILHQQPSCTDRYSPLRPFARTRDGPLLRFYEGT